MSHSKRHNKLSKECVPCPLLTNVATVCGNFLQCESKEDCKTKKKCCKRGRRGFQGTQGTQGRQGNQGFQGFGFQGTQGVQGIPGSATFQGLQGPQGFQGFQGPVGFQGAQGFFGAQGFQGGLGAQGFQGFGFQGTQGIVGATGGILGFAEFEQFTQNSNVSVAPGRAILYNLDNPAGIFNTLGISTLSGPAGQGTAFNLPVGTYVIDYENSADAAWSLAIYQGSSNTVLTIVNHTISGASTATTWIHGRAIIQSTVGNQWIMVSPVVGTQAIPTAGTAAGRFEARITFIRLV